jgi:hypothetical protein
VPGSSTVPSHALPAFFAAVFTLVLPTRNMPSAIGGPRPGNTELWGQLVEIAAEHRIQQNCLLFSLLAGNLVWKTGSQLMHRSPPGKSEVPSNPRCGHSLAARLFGRSERRAGAPDFPKGEWRMLPQPQRARPPGRARLETRPNPTGSLMPTKRTRRNP